MSNVKHLSLLFFILETNFADIEKCHTPLDVRIKGNSYVGPLEVCWSTDYPEKYQWWAVCAYNYDYSDVLSYWDPTTAISVCRKLNFTDPSYQGIYIFYVSIHLTSMLFF